MFTFSGGFCSCGLALYLVLKESWRRGGNNKSLNFAVYFFLDSPGTFTYQNLKEDLAEFDIMIKRHDFFSQAYLN